MRASSEGIPATPRPLARAAAAFWDYAAGLYAEPGVMRACLALQDGANADVNLLLFACWSGAVYGRRLTAADWRRIERALAPWRAAMTAPLRDLRRSLRGASVDDRYRIATLRTALLRAELASEAVGQWRIVRAADAGRWRTPRLRDSDAAAANLVSYAKAAGIAPTRTHDRQFAALLSAALAIAPDQAAAALRAART